jgi:predicted transcriptional regulator
MEEKKLVIVPKKFKTDTTTIISARVSVDLMRKIESLAKKTNRNRNEMIQILLDYAVDNAVIKSDEEKEGK